MIESKALVNEQVAACTVTVVIDGREYHGTGYAKKHPKDKPDERIGLLLAYTRALTELAAELEEEANFLIRYTCGDGKYDLDALMQKLDPRDTPFTGNWWTAIKASE